MSKVFKSTQFITSGDIGSDFTSNPIDVGHINRLGIELAWTTAAVNATIYVQATITGTNYGNLTAGGTAITATIAAANGTQIFDLDVTAFDKVQVFVDNSSGSPGTINGWWRAIGEI